MIITTSMNFGSLPMCNGLTRLETRFYNQQEDLEKIQSSLGKPLDAEQALDLGLVTFIPDDIDWDVLKFIIFSLQKDSSTSELTCKIEYE